MKYFLDTEFHEYQKQPKLLGLKIDKPIDTIELISVGIVSEDSTIKISHPSNIMNIGLAGNKLFGDTNDSKNWNTWENKLPSGNHSIKSKSTNEVVLNSSKEYYAICKDFDLKAAWKNEWLRKNVLKPIMQDLCYKHTNAVEEWFSGKFNFDEFKKLINKYGKTRKQIAEEIIEFVYIDHLRENWDYPNNAIITKQAIDQNTVNNPIEFYAYYADYDWVVFCQLWPALYPIQPESFETGMSYMNPKGFPYYCKDLKQILDKKASQQTIFGTFEVGLEKLTTDTRYPKQSNEHNALADAKWNKELYKFLNKI